MWPEQAVWPEEAVWPEQAVWPGQGVSPGQTGLDLSFVLGTGRCGSTLVHEVLAHHRAVGFVSNIDDNLPAFDLRGRWNGQIYRRVPPRFSQKGRLRFAPSEAYRLLDRQVSPMISNPSRNLTAEDATPWVSGQFRRFFEARAEAQHRPAFLHKFTGWPRVGFISAVFPEARFINIIRDGRAVANSWLQMPWWRGYRGPEGWPWGSLPARYEAAWEDSDRSFVALAGIGWMVLMDAFEQDQAQVPVSRSLEIRYEDIVTDPRGEHRRMLTFLGLDWGKQFEAAFRRYSFSSARHDAYRRDLSLSHVALLEKIQGERLARYGYL